MQLILARSATVILGPILPNSELAMQAEVSIEAHVPDDRAVMRWFERIHFCLGVMELSRIIHRVWYQTLVRTCGNRDTMRYVYNHAWLFE